MERPTPVVQWRGDWLALLRLTGPVALARIGVMAMGLTDAVVVGRTSALELSYQALGWALPAVAMVAAMGFLSGVPVMAARYHGQGRPELTGGVLKRGLRYALGIGLGAGAGDVADGGVDVEQDLAEIFEARFGKLALLLTTEAFLADQTRLPEDGRGAAEQHGRAPAGVGLDHHGHQKGQDEKPDKAEQARRRQEGDGAGHGGEHLPRGHLLRAVPAHHPGRRGHGQAVQAVLVSWRNFQPCCADNAGIDS
jgi:hypothetical protein